MVRIFRKNSESRGSESLGDFKALGQSKMADDKAKEEEFPDNALQAPSDFAGPISDRKRRTSALKV